MALAPPKQIVWLQDTYNKALDITLEITLHKHKVLDDFFHNAAVS